MNRRTAIRNVVWISAGAALLPSCFGDSKASVPLKNISVTASQEEMLAALSETILPSTPAFIGSKDLKAQLFMLTMVDDCVKPEDQQKFIQGMEQFDKTCKEKQSESFAKCSPEKRHAFLTQVEKKDGIPEETLFFYGMAKRYTVQCFTSSQKYMTDIRKYKIVPGSRFRGCVPVKKA